MLAFREYLKRRKSFCKMMLTVAEQANGPSDAQAIEINRALIEQLDDIIQHFDIFVKVEKERKLNDPDN